MDALLPEGYEHIIDGKRTTSPTTQGIINPATSEVFAHVPVATPEQLEETVLAAERAFPAWSQTSWDHRQKVLYDIADLIEKHAGYFSEMLMKEVGKDRASAEFELNMTPSWMRAATKDKLEDELVFENEDRIAKNRFRPFGVCGGIIPFNFPVVLIVLKAAQALLAGNCLIIKAPPTSPCTALKLVELMQSLLPRGVLSALYGGNDLGERIVQHPKISRIAMTGSTAAGKAVMRAAAAELKVISLELGGNDPAIILEDVDPKEMAQRVLVGATHNCGQTCFNMKRIYVHERVYDAVRDELVALAQNVKIGNPFDSGVSMGPVQNDKQHERLCGLLADCKEKGYNIVYESKNLPQTGKGYYIPLVIVDNPPEDSRLVTEEQFGPFIPLLKWSTDEEVVQRANNSEYGFASSVWGRDMDRVQRIADGLYNGMVWVNEWGAVGGDFPLVGAKHSGLGVESTKHGLMGWTYMQSWVCKKTY